MSDPVKELEDVMVANLIAEASVRGRYGIDYEASCSLDASNVQLIAAVRRHGPAILARLRAAEAAVPKWRKATEEDRRLARLGFRFLQIMSYMRSPGEGSPWDLEMTTHLESDDEFKRYWVRDLPDDPPEEPQP